MKTVKMVTLIAMVVTLAVCVTAALSQGPGRSGAPDGPVGPPPHPPSAVPPPPPADRVEDIARALDLTTDQTADLKEVLEEIAAAMKPLFEAVQSADRDLREAFVKGDFDSAMELAVKAGDAKLAVTKASISGWAKIKSDGGLTAEQFAGLLAGPSGPPPGRGNGGPASRSTRQ